MDFKAGGEDFKAGGRWRGFAAGSGLEAGSYSEKRAVANTPILTVTCSSMSVAALPGFELPDERSEDATHDL